MPLIDNALLRALPDLPEVLARIKSGEFTLHGGVVRHAAGTGKGGQIVGHLLFPGDALKTQQSLQKLQTIIGEGFESMKGNIGQLQQSMNVLQGLQVANLALSGLNLAVSAAGFVIVCKKLDRISEQIQLQSHGIAQTLHLVREAHEHSLLGNEAQFRALLITAQQFCEQGETEQLKPLIVQFNREYQFTRLVLEKHAPVAASNMGRFNEIEILQDRLVNLGLMLSHVQMRTGGARYGQECLMGLADDILTFNSKRVEALGSDRDTASRMTSDHYANVISFLEHGKKIVPALGYQAEVIDLEISHPGVLQRASESEDVVLLVA